MISGQFFLQTFSKILLPSVFFFTAYSFFEESVTRGNFNQIKGRIKKRRIYKNPNFEKYYTVINKTYLYIHIQNNHENNRSKKTLLLYLSGFGGNNGEINNLFPQKDKIEEYCDTIDYLVPCFEFTHYTSKMAAPLLNTDFGQIQDINAVLVGLKEFCLSKPSRYNRIAIIGRSRGGSVAINLIGILSIKDHPLLVQNAISEEERLALLALIVQGGVVLVTPLIDLKHAMQKIFGKFFGFFVYQSSELFLPRLYKKKSMLKPLKTIFQWDNHKIPVLILFVKKDLIVGEKYNELFAEYLSQKNGKSATIIYVEGEHSSNQCVHKITAQTITEKLKKNPEFNIVETIVSLHTGDDKQQKDSDEYQEI